MQEQHPCYYPGEFAPPTKMHLNAMHWLLNRPEVSHVHVVIGKDNGPIGQNQKAKLWELLMKSSFSPQATVIKSKDKGPLSEIYSIFNEKRDKPGYIALDEKAARHKKLQEKFDQFPNYGMQLIPSQFSKSSAKMHKAVLEGDFETVKAELPPDFSDVQIKEYMSILKQPAADSPLEDKSHIINYKEQYTKKFDDGFWKSLFQPMAESIELNEAITDSAKKKAIEKFKKEKPELGDAQIKYYIDKFSDKQSSNVFKKKDIFQYTFDELEKLIDANFPSDVSTKTDDDEVDFKGSEDVVYNENGLLIILGDLKEKCIRYGRGYSWCISRKDTSNMFFSYRMRLNEPVFYFIFDEDKPKDDKYHAIVIYINNRGEYYVASSINKGDEKMSWSDIETIQPKLKGLKKLFKHIPLNAEERKDYNRFYDPIDDLNYEKLTYTDKEKYISFTHDLTEKQIRSTPKDLISKYVTTTSGENIPKDIEKSLPPSDQKKLRDNRIQSKGERAKFLHYPEELKPEDLNVKDSLNLSSTNITSLPDNLSVQGMLNLSRSKIKSLPDNLSVGELSISDTDIKYIPDNIKVKYSIYLRNTKIEYIPDNIKLLSYLNAEDSLLNRLPDNLEIYAGDLFLSNSKIKSLPKNLKVRGNLDLTNTPIKSLPDDLQVKGYVFGNDSIQKQWEEIKNKRNQK